MERILKTEWIEGEIEFYDLLKAFPSHTHISLAKELDIPMPEHVVSVRHALYWWPVQDNDRITKAHQDYDEGKVELTTGRVSNHFVLYAIPRKYTATRKYFNV